MISCPNCGIENNDFEKVCYSCGASLPVQNVKNTKSGSKTKNIGKKLTVIVLAVAAMVGMVGGVKLLADMFSHSVPLKRALNDSISSLAVCLGMEEDMTDYEKLTSDLLKQGEYTLHLEYANDELAMNADYDLSRKDKVMSGVIQVGFRGQELVLDFSVEDDLLLVSSQGQLEETYGIPLEKLSELIQKSPLKSVVPQMLTQLIQDPFENKNRNSIIPKEIRSQLESWIDSVDVEFLEERTLSGVNCSIECDMYQVTWDKTKASKVVTSLKEQGVWGNITSFFMKTLLDLDPDIRFYVDQEGALAGADLIYLGAKYYFVLEGDENPWDKVSLTVKDLNGSERIYTGGIYETSSGMELGLKEDNHVFFCMCFENDGDFYVRTAQVGTVLSGRIVARSDGSKLEVSFQRTGETMQYLSYEIEELEDTPRPLAKYYIDLIDMDISDWQRLMIDLGITLPIN